MNLTVPELAELAAQFETKGFKPPRQVSQALASLAGDALITNPLVAMTHENMPSGGTDVVWYCVGVAGNALVSARGRRRADEWNSRSPIRQSDPPPVVHGVLIPLTEIIGCRLVSIEDSHPDYWSTRWEVHLRNSPDLQLPWSESDYEMQGRHEELGLKLAALLR